MIQSIQNMDISWMTKTQKVFFQILLIEENRNKSRIEISKLAGYNDKKTTAWYRVIKDSKFRELLENMNVKAISMTKKKESLPNIIEGIDVSWMTIPQRKFFKILSKIENRDKSRKKICELAGYYENAIQWYTAINDEKFYKLLESMQVMEIIEKKLINGIDVSWMTEGQKKFIRVLSKEENRDKSVEEISELAGYKNSQQWHTVIKDEKFYDLLESMHIREIMEKKLINGINVSWMTESQRKFIKVLSKEENRDKSVEEISKLAGYKSSQQWYIVIKDKRFFKLLESMEVKGIYKTNSINEEIINGINISWMTNIQKKFFRILLIENNRNKSVEDICKLANYSISTWYKCIKDEQYNELIKSMNVDLINNKKLLSNIIDGTDISWMNKTQRKIYEVLLVEDNRDKNIAEICELAGYSKKSAKKGNPWYSAINNMEFFELLKSMNIKAACDMERIPDIINGTDVSWMTKTQKKFFMILSRNKDYSLNEIYTLAGYSTKGSKSIWYKSIKDERFRDLLISMGVKLVRRNTYPPHREIKYIDDGICRKEYIKNSAEWDMRKLVEKYPRHISPSRFIIDFKRIKNKEIQKEIRNYFINRLNYWDPTTFATVYRKLIIFIECIEILFENLDSLYKLERTKHIEHILRELEDRTDGLNGQFNRVINEVQNLFYYMEVNNTENIKYTELINKYDKKKVDYVTKAKPIPIDIRNQLDDYLINVIMPLLERDKKTPIVDPEVWDMIIIARYTGRRTEDMCHLISEDTTSSKNKTNRNLKCLQYDLDGEPMLYLDHRIAKIKKDLMITIAHLKDSRGINIVEQAVLRQMKRVENLPCAPDGYKYLFRQIINDSGNKNDNKLLDNLVTDVPLYPTIRSKLVEICRKIPIVNKDGTVYTIAMHQFRHTVATEMIDAGVDIWAVKEFLGHDSVAMTEKYIKAYENTINLKVRLDNSDATEIKKTLKREEGLFTSQWVKNKIIAVFEQGDGCCEHIYKIAACPHMECKVCRKKKIYPRHITAVKHTISSFKMHRDNALELGLIEKSKEFDLIVNFYTKALRKIEVGDMFDAEIDFYKNN